MHRNIDYESLKNQNFQLKNEITDLKNAFDLNRDVLKILEDQTKTSQPKSHIFYQIISRLTGINNQIMISNLQLIQQKSKLTQEKKRMEFTIDTLNQKINEEIKVMPANQMFLQMNTQIKNLHAEVLALNEECLRRKIQISQLYETLNQAEMKKPLIPSIKRKRQDSEYEHQAISKNRQNSHIRNIPIRNESNQILRMKLINKNMKKENSDLKKLVEELQYRLTLLSSIYKIEPLSTREIKENQEKSLTEIQLGLLLFSLNNLELQEDQQTQNIKLTVTKRCKPIMNCEEPQRVKSCPK